MRKLLLLLIATSLFAFSQAQVKTSVIMANASGEKELASKSVTFNVGSAIPYIFDGGSNIKLQVGFPYNALYMGNTFSPDFFVSKGYFSNHILLKWKVIGNEEKIDHFEIYRLELGGQDTIWMNNVTADVRSWEDHYSEANVVYTYIVYAIGIPGEKIEGYTHISGNGFRTPFATVSGRVTFPTGTGVSGVTVSSSTDDNIPSYGILLQGDGYVAIPQEESMDIESEFTFQAYVKFDGSNDVGIFQKYGNYKITYESGNFRFYVGTEFCTHEMEMTGNEFIHISCVYDGDSAYIYIPGKYIDEEDISRDTLIKSSAFISNTISNNESTIHLGYTDNLNYNGYIDEIRLWNKALEPNEILNDFYRYITGTEEGILAYWRINEGFGENIYDISKSGSTFNENHGIFVGNSVSWSNVYPTREQLGYKAITDLEGNYIITGIPFASGGSAYKFTPMMAPHEFDPGSKILFLSEGATVHNNIDFVDISVVPVSLTIFYKNTHFPVEGVLVKVDGQYISDVNNNLVQTKEDGTVDFEVPIGNHYLTFEKQNHTFNEPSFPPKDDQGNIVRYFFNKALSINIYDTTRVKLAGKIVGGPVEASKLLGLDKLPRNPTINNIGVVNVELTTVSGFDIDLDENGDPVDATPKTITFSTDQTTGEYEIWLLPEQYQPTGDYSIKNDRYIFNSFDDKAIIDMSNQFFVKYETDSSFIQNSEGILEFDHLDTTANYNLRRDWIYRSESDFEVLNKDGGKIISHVDYEFTDENDIVDTIKLAYMSGEDIVYPFGKPIFFFGQDYNLSVRAFEEYVNPARLEDSIDIVPVTDGRVLIANDLALQLKDVELQLDEKGEAEYNFEADFPNIAAPYTKNLNISFITPGSVIQWPTMEAFILGGRPTGNNFVTTGPNKVDYILRDPPGSNSYATLDKGFVTTNKHSWSMTNKSSGSLGLKTLLGSKIVIASGTPIVQKLDEVSTLNNLSVVASGSVKLGGGFDKTTVTRFNESYSTSNKTGFVGLEGDVFFGQSTNIVYGICKIMGIMDITEIPSGTDTIAQHNSYAISMEDGLRVNPEFDTYFVYTQKTIEKEIIPNLKQLRNIALEGDRYVKVFTDTKDTLYGLNNDDALWGSEASENPNIGPSYIYTLPSPLVDSIIDTVRYYNTQITDWLRILAQNEEEKTIAKMDDYHKNISFGAGVTYKSSIGRDYNYTRKFIYNLSLGVKMAYSIGLDINGTGSYLVGDIESLTETGGVLSDGTTTTDKVTYTLSDDNSTDYLTVDVKKCQAGHGPVFETKGGQTSCPYEGEEFTRYFEPGLHTLSAATMKVDGPQLSVDNPISPLVPETAPALFTMNLSNVSEAEKERWYMIGVDVASNPDGAKIMMDGSTINDGMAVCVPYGETVVKTIEVYKGRADVNEYENLNIYLQSSCESGISDNVLISAFFASACSQLEIDHPGSGWVINFNDHDTLLVQISNYNLQHEGFEDIYFQYTPTGTSNWTTVHIFTNYPLVGDEPGKTFIDGETSLQFFWDMKSLPDRAYDIRLVSHCADGSENYSSVLSGILDGQLPQVFGTPQPADGILNIDDDILVQFNEPIEGGLLTQYNFNVKGTLNNYPINHDAFLKFNGTSNFCYIPEGISFNDKSFTIEFWMRPSVYTNSVILSQGTDPAKCVEIGLRDTDKTYLKIGNTEFVAPFQFTSDVTSTDWQHMAYVFDYDNNYVSIYQNDKNIYNLIEGTVEVNNSGKIYIGKSSVTGGDYFYGDIHDLRIWSKTWVLDDIYANKDAALSGNEIGLYGYWTIDEAFGQLAVDKAANRHMEVFANWKVEPEGTAWDFAGNNCLEFGTGYFAVIPEMDFTLEFWFQSANPTDTVCMFSNQKGDGNDGENLINKALSIFATPDGKIWVASQGNLFEAATNNYFDNSWHHFALIVRRSGNVISYVDGIAQNEKENTIIGGISGGNMVLGALKWDNTTGNGEDWYYQGKMDEFRLWNLSKTVKQIQIDMNSMLHGDEIGLMVYFPFERYIDDGFGNLELINTLENYLDTLPAVPCVGDAFTHDAPNVKNARPVEAIAFGWVAAEDKVIVMPKVFLMPQLEKNIIEITVQGIEDKYGNRMASPETWTAYVHQNQIRWEDDRRSFTKEIYKPLSFISSIKNTGGQQIGFNIQNLPPWLSANPSYGVINPESTFDIEFTINPALNIGEYNEDIILHTENGFDEKLPITVRVYKTPPDWQISPNLFGSTMNMVGRIKIEGVLSTDIFDKVAAFKRGTDSIQGVANLRYLKDFDSYLVFLNVFGNTSGEPLEFRIWDASVGQILDNVRPFDTTFIAEGVLGTTYEPVIFEATGLYRQYIPLAKGWNWVSFNKWSNERDSLNLFFSSLEPNVNDQIKTKNGYSQFNFGGWPEYQGIDSIENKLMYQIKISNNDTIIYSGEDIVPEDNPIALAKGWNYIGYLPDLSMDVNDALRVYTADSSEIIKSQYAFSMYDTRTGWLGTLEVMQPGYGYMLNVKKAGTLTYPNSTIFKNVSIPHYTSPPIGWGSDLSQYSGTLSMIAKLDVSGTPEVTVNNQMVLGAFINGENHGFISPLGNPGIGYQPFFLNVSNNTDDQWIEFRVFDGMTGNTYRVNEKKWYRQNAVYGSTQNPVVLTLKTLTTGGDDFKNGVFLSCYPNPFNKHINVEFAGVLNKVSIDVLTATGALVKRIYNGYPVNGINKVVWDGNNGHGSVVSSGVYYIRFVSAGSVQTIKISKTN